MLCFNENGHAIVCVSASNDRSYSSLLRSAPESDVDLSVVASPALVQRRYDTDSDSVLTYEEFELFFVDYLCRTDCCNCCV